MYLHVPLFWKHLEQSDEILRPAPAAWLRKRLSRAQRFYWLDGTFLTQSFVAFFKICGILGFLKATSDLRLWMTCELRSLNWTSPLFLVSSPLESKRIKRISCYSLPSFFFSLLLPLEHRHLLWACLVYRTCTLKPRTLTSTPTVKRCPRTHQARGRHATHQAQPTVRRTILSAHNQYSPSSPEPRK